MANKQIPDQLGEFKCCALAGGRPSGDKFHLTFSGFSDFPFSGFSGSGIRKSGFSGSGNPDFQSVHVNQLSKSFKMSGHMIFFPDFWFFRISRSGIRKFGFAPVLA